MSELPQSAYPHCTHCGAAVTDPDSRLVLHEVTGWERHRAQGGTNHIINRRTTGRVLCVDCSMRIQRLGALGQEAMF